MKTRSTINLFLLLAFVLVLSLFLFSKINDFGMALSFVSVLIPLVLLFRMVLNNSTYYFEATVLLFFLMFFFIAPILQITYGSLPNTLPIKDELVLKANLYNALFLIAFILFRNLLSKKGIINTKEIHFNHFGIIMFILSFIFIPVLLWDSSHLINTILTGESDSEQIKSQRLIIGQVIYIFPLFIFSYLVYQIKLQKKIINIRFLYCLIFFILLVFVKNFFVENRGTVGPIYLALFAFFFIEKLNSFKYFIFLLSVLLVLFPLTDMFVHSPYNLVDYLEGNVNILETFNETFTTEFQRLDYDAWSNFMATIEYVERYGHTLGQQLLGSVFFFVPRSLWITKPNGTGQLVGQYLMDNYSMWFYNLSNPLQSEGFIEFGLIGIILYAAFLAYLGKLTFKMINSNSYAKFIGIYISFQMMLFLRGDLISSGSFFIASLFSVWFFPKIIDKSIALFKKK